MVIIKQSRYRGWYRGRDIIVRPRRYGNMATRWEAYFPDEHDPDYPGAYIGYGNTLSEAFDTAHNVIDAITD